MTIRNRPPTILSPARGWSTALLLGPASSLSLGVSAAAAVSGRGSSLRFLKIVGRARVAARVVLAAGLPAAHAAPGDTTRVSTAADGAQGNAGSRRASVSADFRYVAFESFASNLVAGDGNGCTDIFVRDLQTGTVELISISSSGTQSNADSFGASISDDGRYVTFETVASNLVPGDTNSRRDVFVRDLEAGTTERVSVSSGGVQGDDISFSPTISGDGRHVAFQSRSSNLVGDDTNDTEDIFVHDRQTGTTEQVSIATDGTQANSYSQGAPISSWVAPVVAARSRLMAATSPSLRPLRTWSPARPRLWRTSSSASARPAPRSESASGPAARK